MTPAFRPWKPSRHPGQRSPRDDLAALEAREIEFWRDSEEEGPTGPSLRIMLNKCREADVFRRAIIDIGHEIRAGASMLELGAGQGWGSCLMKRLYPTAHVTCSDISPYAIAALPYWERVFDVSVDASISCKSYSVPLETGSVDCVFCFAAAHHFKDQAASFKEIARVLRPGGVALLMYEPCSPAFLRGVARWRVERKRPAVPEDVLVRSDITRLARQASLEAQIVAFPDTAHRSGLAVVYYALMSCGPKWLHRLLPCTVNVTLFKDHNVSVHSDSPDFGRR